VAEMLWVDALETYKANYFEEKQIWTWQLGGSSSTNSTRSRLDRIYVTGTIKQSVMQAGTQDTTLSDHLIYEIHLTTPEEHRKYPTGWKLNVQLLEDKVYTDKIDRFISKINKEAQSCDNPIDILGKQKELIEGIKRISKRFGKAKAKKLNQKKRNVELKRSNLQERLQTLTDRTQTPNEEANSVTREYGEVNQELQGMFERNAEAAKVRTHTNIALHSEIPSSSFLRLQNERRRKSRIEEVLGEDGTPSHWQEDIVATHLTFQSNLYSKKPIQEEAKRVLLETIKTHVTTEDTAKNNLPFNREEILMAIKSLGKNKAAGTDGLPAEFY
jgi:hypothetical protein